MPGKKFHRTLHQARPVPEEVGLGVELDVATGMMIRLHYYLSKTTISTADIADGKQLGRDLHVVYREMNKPLGMKEFAVCFEVWAMLEENFDEMKISPNEMIGPMILGGMQNLERIHRDDKLFAQGSCSTNGKLFVRLLTLKAILFASNTWEGHIRKPVAMLGPPRVPQGATRGVCHGGPY